MMDSEQMQLKYKPIKVCGICGDKALGMFSALIVDVVDPNVVLWMINHLFFCH